MLKRGGKIFLLKKPLMSKQETCPKETWFIGKLTENFTL